MSDSSLCWWLLRQYGVLKIPSTDFHFMLDEEQPAIFENMWHLVNRAYEYQTVASYVSTLVELSLPDI